MRRALLACFASMFTVLLSAVLLVAPAYAATGDYSIDELSTEVTVETNGTAHVVERQTLTFEKQNNGIVWYVHVPESGESVRISSVRVAPVDNGGTLLGGWTLLQMVDSRPQAQGRNPGDTAQPSLRTSTTQPWYSYSIGDGMVRAYFPVGEDAGQEQLCTYIVEIDYTIAHRVRVYRDVAELYWRYANDSLPHEASNVSLQVRLPMPADTDTNALSDEVLAWGHGPSNGSFSVGSDGSVTYLLDHIEKGAYAEAHVIFPASWMTNMAHNSANLFSELRRPQAVLDEAEWVDVGLRQAAWDYKVRILFLCIAAVVIACGIVSIIRNGRSPKSRRALIRVATTLAIIALGEHLFFREPLSTLFLLGLGAVTGITALAFPQHEEELAEETTHEKDE